MGEFVIFLRCNACSEEGGRGDAAGTEKTTRWCSIKNVHSKWKLIFSLSRPAVIGEIDDDDNGRPGGRKKAANRAAREAK